MKTQTMTPWGVSDGQNELAPGVVMHHTASHGGFNVSPEVRAGWPEGLGEYTSRYAPIGWFEEDCDWAVVALAMPEVFEPEMVRAAVMTAKGWLCKSSPIIRRFFETERGAAMLAKYAEPVAV